MRMPRTGEIWRGDAGPVLAMHQVRRREREDCRVRSCRAVAVPSPTRARVAVGATWSSIVGTPCIKLPKVPTLSGVPRLGRLP